MLFVVHLDGGAGDLQRVTDPLTGLHERLQVLREAGAAEPRSGVQKLVADPIVQPHALGNHLHIRTDPFADGGDFVDEGNLHRQEGVGRILDHLRGRDIGDDERCLEQEQRPVEVFHDRDGLLAVGADDHAVGAHEILDRGSLAEKFGVRHDVEGESARLVGFDDLAQFFTRADRYR